jgi:hypothetical protein
MILLGQHKPRLLDLFCGAGGAGEGYSRAGFAVHGIDLYSQKNYPYTFTRCDALEYLLANAHGYDAIHASPVCQHHSWAAAKWRNNPDYQTDYDDDLLPDCQRELARLNIPYVIENTRGAPLDCNNTVTLCGCQFAELKVFRPRKFETNWLLLATPKCNHRGKRVGFGEDDYVTVAGHGGDGTGKYIRWCDAMDIHWMTKYELTQSIPPAYTEYIGRQLVRVLA